MSYPIERRLQIEAAVDDYLSLIEGGERVAIDDFVKRYVGIEKDLREFFEMYQALQRADVTATETFSTLPLPLAPPRGPSFIGSLQHFDIIERVGTGGMSVVYRALDSRSQLPVAVKVLLPHSLDDARALHRFARECSATLALSHPNLVRVIEALPTHSPPFLVMELVDGGTLEKRIATSREGLRMELAEILAVSTDILLALEHIHGAGYVHRDVKPGNVMFPLNGGKALLGDFGLVRSYKRNSSVTGTGGIVGTAAFMSPEQAEGGIVDHRSDLFSLGSVIYAMCTGSSPFQGRTAFETILSIRTLCPKPLREISPDVPAWLSSLVSKLHHTHPKRRCQSAAEVLEVFAENSPLGHPRRVTDNRAPVLQPKPVTTERSASVVQSAASTRADISEIQSELRNALEDVLREVGSKLSPHERKEIQGEFDQLQTLLERLKTGKVWIALFGKTNAGKSALTNAIVEDDLAPVGVEHDYTRAPATYERDGWKIVDVPGVLGQEVLADIALREAKQAHAHIFVVDGEPFDPELRLFNIVHDAMPHTPCIIFVNKWDVITASMPMHDREKIRKQLEAKMGHLVASPRDIIYGCALKYDAGEGVMVRQRVPDLLQRMYDDNGPFGDIINVIDPANRAADLTEAIRQRVFEVRMRVARKIIAVFGGLCAASTLAPYSQLLIDPALLGAMVMVLVRVMGKETTKVRATEIARALLTNCGLVLGGEFVASVATEVVIDTLSFVLGPFGVLVGGVVGMAALGYWKFFRTAVLGEVTLEYIRNDFSWGGMEPRQVILACKARAQKLYARLKDDP